MTPTPDELADETRFRRVDVIAHADVAAAIRPHLRRRSLVTLAYWGLNVVALLVVAWTWRRAGLGLLEGFPTLCLGMVGGLVLLLPIHEWIHAVAYRGVGARQVRVRWEWRRVTAQCVADRQVVGRSAFALVCLAPLLVLEPPLLLAALLAPAGSWALAIAGAFLLHTGAVSGDVALVNLLWRERAAPELWTYDDVAAGESYFFAPR